MMIVVKKFISRRTMLRGMGTAVALPFLDCMVPALTALEQTAARPARRLGVFYLPNGMSMFDGRWTPATEGTDFALTPILAPLAPFREHLLVVSGLTNQPAFGRKEDGAGDHTRGSASYLTAAYIKKTEGADFRSDGISIDQMVAKELRNETQLASLELGLDSVELLGACDPGYSCAYKSTIAWRTLTTPLPMENHPRAVFERLFGATGTTEPRARRVRLQQERSLLDSMIQDVARFGKRLSASDRGKVEQYLEAIRDAEKRIQMAEKQSARELPLVDEPGGDIPADIEDHLKLMFDLLTLAYQGDLTRIFTFMLTKELSSHAYPRSGVSESHHAASHHQYDPNKLEALARLNTYHVQQFTYFLEKLRSTPDGEGSLLDHSMILYGAGISDSDRHSHENLPVLLLGGGAGQLKGGRHVRYPMNTPLANLHLTLSEKMGVQLARFGDSTGTLPGI